MLFLNFFEPQKPPNKAGPQGDDCGGVKYASVVRNAIENERNKKNQAKLVEIITYTLRINMSTDLQLRASPLTFWYIYK